MDDQWEIPKLDIEKTSYTVYELLEWNSSNKLVLSPDFQRGQVWKTPAKAYLIDTILRGFPIPPIHIRFVNRGGTFMREVIDGQQRLNSVIQFTEDRFPLSRAQTSAHGPRPPWAGMKFNQLDTVLQDRVLNYSFRCEAYKGQMSDGLIREIFSRINIHSVPLSDQEIRNGRYFGEFKQSVYGLAEGYLEFWRASGLFSSQQLARMLDAQFVSEILAVQLEGMRDQKSNIEKFYVEYDQSWPERELHEDRFRTVLDSIISCAGDIIKSSKFSRFTLFYTLYVAVYHRLYGLSEQRELSGFGSLPTTPKENLTFEASERLRSSMLTISDFLESPRRGSSYANLGLVGEFAEASTRHTDNIRPRMQRFFALWRLADLSKP